MKYVGIDLGTTNSAIASYDGEQVNLHKSTDQHDVTPSAIFVTRRGNRFVGSRAYNDSARDPENAALLFKRMMGTSTVFKLRASDTALTPEQCSAEILRTLYAYLPEETRQSSDTGTVITVPAAFNQMQKDSTLAAAEQAGIGRVALMQEPVAAVMSVMRQRGQDGAFLIYDFGGGTLDIAIAESIKGRVSLLAHGGIEMCGGRDIDRAIIDQVVKPWLVDTFELPDGFAADAKYTKLLRMAAWAGEKAKIELSAGDEAIISLSENELGLRDELGDEIYLDVPLSRAQLDRIIAPLIDDGVKAARETVERAGMTSADVERIVFVGGPTQYKPLRDKVAFEMGIAASTDVNPMTAVAEGAAIFAESIDWTNERRGRKASRGAISTGATDLAFAYQARTPDDRARVVAQYSGPADGSEFQVDSLDTGWTSGRIALRHGAAADLPLAKSGANSFKLFVFDASGAPIRIAEDRITINRTAASIDAIPASHTVSIEALTKRGGISGLVHLVRSGDALPKKGQVKFRAAEALAAGSNAALNFKMWEGEIEDPVNHNQFIGNFRVSGSDFEDGLISSGAEIVCDYEVTDSGNVVLNVSIEGIGAFHSGRNFYSRQAGAIDYSRAAAMIQGDAKSMLERVEEIGDRVDDDRIAGIKQRLERAGNLDPDEGDPETAKHAMDGIRSALKDLADVRRDHLKSLRQMDLDGAIEFFNAHCRSSAKPVDEQTFDNLARTAQAAIDNGSKDFESLLSELRERSAAVLWRDDNFIVGRFHYLAARPNLFIEIDEFQALVAQGRAAIAADQIQDIRRVVNELDALRVGAADEGDLVAQVNIVAAR